MLIGKSTKFYVDKDLRIFFSQQCSFAKNKQRNLAPLPLTSSIAMAADGAITMKLTRSSEKRQLRTARSSQLLKRPRNIKKQIAFSPGAEEWYHTRGPPPTVVKHNNEWILAVGYYQRPERKGNKSNPRMRARTIDRKFSHSCCFPHDLSGIKIQHISCVTQILSPVSFLHAVTLTCHTHHNKYKVYILCTYHSD